VNQDLNPLTKLVEELDSMAPLSFTNAPADERQGVRRGFSGSIQPQRVTDAGFVCQIHKGHRYA
jgi:hypothetical protein